MKQFLVALGILALCSNMTYACDGCSLSQSVGLLGIAPKFQGHFIGLKYSYREFSTAHSSTLFGETVQPDSRQLFHSVELSTRAQLHDRVQLLGFVPYLLIEEQFEGRSEVLRGAGDATFLVNYLAFRSEPGSEIAHTVEVNTGIKMPTGKYRKRNSEGHLNPSMQTGSGSWDIPLGFRYTLRSGTWGAAISTGYWLNTRNSLNHKFGDRVYGQLRGFKLFEVGDLGLVPQLGLLIEHADKETNGQQVQTLSGGHDLRLQTAVRANIGSWSFTASYDHSLHNNLSNGLVKPKHQFDLTIHLFI